jgi:glutathionylspermidine synthase
MALNRLQKAVINSHIDSRASGLNGQNIFFQMRTHHFFNTSDGDFYSKKNSVSQVYTYLPKFKKKLKISTIVDV